MPKRKRDADVNTGDRVRQKRRQDVYETYTQCRKLLHRAFKIAKGFERQKLAKRLKIAMSRSNVADIARIRREIDTIKSLDLAKVTVAHLHRNLLKRRPFVESLLLPDEVNILPRPEGTEEMAAALHNVTSGMCNTRDVRDTVERIIIGMYMSMGIPVPPKNVPAAKLKRSRDLMNEEGLSEPKRSIVSSQGGQDRIDTAHDDEELHWDRSASADEASHRAQTPGDEFEAGGEDDIDFGLLDDGDVSHYEALLGNSSEEECFEEEKNIEHKPYTTTGATQHSRSTSPLQPIGLTVTERGADSNIDQDSGPETIMPERTKTTSVTGSKLGGSKFLPSLMGGYYSGSESASDIEESTPVTRKNRPGQMARRALWEKKYGTGANHIKGGKGPIAEKREQDDGWDLKRGARGEARRGKARGGKHHRNRNSAGHGGAIDYDTIIPDSDKKPSGRSDDLGILHPSWQAAKKAKDMNKTAKFAGKKVTFD